VPTDQVLAGWPEVSGSLRDDEFSGGCSSPSACEPTNAQWPCAGDSAVIANRASPWLVVAVAVLLAQCVVAFWQHLGDTRYFAWAPNDYAVTYGLQATVDGRRLTQEEISDRYHLSFKERLDRDDKAELGLNMREHYVHEDPPQVLLDRITWYETGGFGSPARVRLIYQLNGGEEHIWRWP
jgi:hypothetical protein